MPYRRGLRHFFPANHAPTTAIRVAGALAASLAVALSLTGCGVSIGVPSQSPQVSGPTQAGAAPSASASTATGSAGAGSSATPSATGPAVEPTAAVWKSYTDPGRTISFELPQDWTTQLVPGSNPAALHVEVRDQDGAVVATLQTHITGLGGACQPGAMRPYTVLSSIPMAIPSTSTGSTAVDPRFVYRLIQGVTHFYASYGITDRRAARTGRPAWSTTR